MTLREENGRTGQAYELVDGYSFQGTVVRYTVVPGWADGYNCIGNWVNYDGLSTRMQAELRSAMDKWEAVAGIEFVEVPYYRDIDVGPGGQVDIIIAMGKEQPGGAAGVTIAGDDLKEAVRQVNATCGSNSQVDGNDALIVFDTYDVDTGYYETAAELRLFHNVALHEIGHAIGIAHSDLEGHVMSGNSPGTTDYTLTDQYYQMPTWDDIQAARALYGSPRPEPYLNDDYPDATGPTERTTLEGTSAGESLLGTAGADLILGHDGNDRMWGLDGRDQIEGGGGADLIFGMGDRDVVYGGSGDDIFLGGGGNDFIAGDQGELRHTASGDPAPDWHPSHDGNDRIWGQEGNDWIIGDGGRDFLSGGTGHDVIAGGSGQDYCDGGTGDDEIHGNGNPDIRAAGNLPAGWGYGFDAVTGGWGGYDMLAGGAGNDTLYGSSDGATFFGQAGADTFVCQGGTSWIMDFERGVDQVWLGGPEQRVRVKQNGEHVEVQGPTSTVFLSNTTVAELEGVDWLV